MLLSRPSPLRHLTAIAPAALSLLFLPGRAMAQPSGSGDASLSAPVDPGKPSAPGGARSAAAEALFAEGVTLSERGELALACAKFEASQSLDVAVGTLLYLGDCYERTGRLASAWARFREAASLAQAQAMPERVNVANVRAQALEPRLSYVTIVVAAQAPPGLAITLDGTPVAPASWGSALPVDSGVLTLRASAPGHLGFSRQVSISAGEPKHVNVEVPLLHRAPVKSAPKAPMPAASETSDGAARSRTLGIVVSVAGVVGLAGAGALTLAATDKNDESRGYCPDDPNVCAPHGAALREDAGRLADFATASFAIGGALLATGVVLYITSPKAKQREAVALRLAPAFGDRGAGLQAGGSF